MAQMVFRLNNVPDDEADQVRALLSDNNVDFYETDAGRWGISVAALWVKDELSFSQARELIESFQLTHRESMSQQFEADKAAGRIPSFWQLFSDNPAMFVLYWVLIIAVVTISIIPIYNFFNN